MRNLFLLLPTLLLLQSCSLAVRSKLAEEKFPPIEAEQEILVFRNSENIPSSSALVGELSIGDKGFSTDCDYETVLAEAKKTARKSGSNLLLIKEIIEPDVLSTCYRIKAGMYRNLDKTFLAELEQRKAERNKSRLPADADYAMVYFFRNKEFSGSLVSYKIRLEDDTVIGKIKNGKKLTYKVTDFGAITFSAKTEAEETITLNIEKGQEYFIECGVKLGAFVGRPTFSQVENNFGIRRCEELEQ
ncbi:MAG: DUF2846 domain-containing protein [Saprospiraceae bacterium]|nr:DUF2846 domain-containing protein [Saprospiraceae bacterium]